MDQRQQQGRNWLVKTDSLGCDDVSCLDTAIDDPTDRSDESMALPQSCAIIFILQVLVVLKSRQLEIYDYSGKKVKLHK
ncbi:MAG: hypothetical protein IPP06_06635 [Saprospiraceae bacterium]|nr:hypothetical protein [Candidatus Vicinibacter affinis]